MNAFGLKFCPGPPWIMEPEKTGFNDGRTGLRESPSFDGLYESCGVNGRPDTSVSIPLSCQFPIAAFHHRLSPEAPLRPNGRSYVALMTAAFRTSKEARP